MRMSDEFLAKLKDFEGYSPKAYKCPAGVLTIGYGHTGSDVKTGMVIDESKATELLRADLREAEEAVENYVTAKISQHQFDALADFVYNCGSGNFRKSTLLRRVNANPKDYKGIGDAFMMWNKAGGKVLNGLTRRRQEEIDWYKKG